MRYLRIEQTGNKRPGEPPELKRASVSNARGVRICHARPSHEKAREQGMELRKRTKANGPNEPDQQVQVVLKR